MEFCTFFGSFWFCEKYLFYSWYFYCKGATSHSHLGVCVWVLFVQVWIYLFSVSSASTPVQWRWMGWIEWKTHRKIQCLLTANCIRCAVFDSTHECSNCLLWFLDGCSLGEIGQRVQNKGKEEGKGGSINTDSWQLLYFFSWGISWDFRVTERTQSW